jgi:hypothetical protein
MRKRKTHSWRGIDHTGSYAKCGRRLVVGDTLAGMPTCLTCKRALAAQKGKK